MKTRRILACIMAIAMIASFSLSVAANTIQYHPWIPGVWPGGDVNPLNIGTNSAQRTMFGWMVTGEFPRWEADLRVPTTMEVSISGTIPSDSTIGRDGVLWLPGIAVGETIEVRGINHAGGDGGWNATVPGVVSRVTVGGQRGLAVTSGTGSFPAGVNNNATLRGVSGGVITAENWYFCQTSTCIGTNSEIAGGCGEAVCAEGFRTGTIFGGGNTTTLTGPGTLFVGGVASATNTIRHGSIRLPIVITMDVNLAGSDATGPRLRHLDNWNNALRARIGPDQPLEGVNVLGTAGIMLNSGFNANTGAGVNSTTDNNGGWFTVTNTNLVLSTLSAGSATMEGSTTFVDLTRDIFTTAEMRQIATAAEKGAALRIDAAVFDSVLTANWNTHAPFTVYRARVERILGRDAYVDTVHIVPFNPSWWNWQSANQGLNTATFYIPADLLLDDKFDWNVRGFQMQIWFPGAVDPSATWNRFVDIGWSNDIRINTVRFSVEDQPTYRPAMADRGVVMGDVDGNGVVNVQDALLALRLATGQTPAAAINPDAAKMGGGDSVTVSDALAILLLATA